MRLAGKRARHSADHVGLDSFAGRFACAEIPVHKEGALAALKPGTGCMADLQLPVHDQTSAIISISTQAPMGICATPNALRA